MVLRILFLAVLIWLTKIVVSAQSPQPNEPHTVVDYYMLLPDKYFEANRDERLHWMLDPKRRRNSRYIKWLPVRTRRWCSNGHLCLPVQEIERHLSDGSWL